MTNFEIALKQVLNIEADYVNDVNDNGGATNFGITEALARKYGYVGDMKYLPKEKAIEIYKKEFWDDMNLGLIHHPQIATEAFEFAVNSGQKRLAIKFMQRAFNTLQDEIILVEDGILGPKTAQAINNFPYSKLIVKLMNVFQGMFYVALAEGDKHQLDLLKHHRETPGHHKYKHFIRGWINKRVNC